MIVIRSIDDCSLIECFDTCKELKQYVNECLVDCGMVCQTQADKFIAFEEMFGRISFN